MQKAILLEVEGRTGVVLTPTGEFKRVPLPQEAVAVGDEIAYQEHGGWRFNWVAAVAAGLLLLLSPLGYRQWSLAQPMALLMIDINPSLQLTLNGRQQVMAAQGLNADGEAVLEGLSWRQRPVDEVTRALTARAVSAGKLDPTAEGSAVVVAVAPASRKPLPEQQAYDLVERSRSVLQTEVAAQAEAKGSSPRTEVAVIEATATEVEQAKEQGLTVPRLIILKEIQAEHPEVTAEQVRQAPPAQVLKSLGISPSEVFSRAEARHNTKEHVVPATGNQKDGDGQTKSNPGQGDERRNEKGPKEDKPGNNGNGNSGNGNGNQGNGNGNSGNGNGNQGKGNGNQGKGNDNPGQGNSNSGKGNENPGSGPGNSGNGPGNQGKGNDNSGSGNNNPGRGNEDPGSGRGNQGKGNSNPGPGKDNSGNGQGNSGKGPDKPGNGNEKPGQGNEKPGQGNQGNSGEGSTGAQQGGSRTDRVQEEADGKGGSQGKGKGPDGQGPPGQRK